MLVIDSLRMNKVASDTNFLTIPFKSYAAISIFFIYLSTEITHSLRGKYTLAYCFLMIWCNFKYRLFYSQEFPKIVKNQVKC